MPKTIWKYELDVTDHVQIDLPVTAEPLYLAMQYDRVCLWALVDPDASVSTRHFRFFGTGQEIDDSDPSYIGTVMMAGGGLVFHLFEVTKNG